MLKRIMAMGLSLVITALFLAACGNSNQNSGEAASIVMFSNEWQNYDGADKDRVWEFIEEKTGVKLELSGAPINNYNDKINMMVNTNEAPDVFFYLPEDSETYVKWARQGLIIDFSDYVKDDKTYPNLYRLLNDENYKNLIYDGKKTLIPRIAPQNNWAIYIRKDWLDKLGLEEPRTLDDYAAVMRAFTLNDPDGNGKQDTYGLCSSKDFYWFMPFFSAWCKKPGWNYSADGKTMEYVYYTNGYKSFLSYMSGAYSGGYIVKDFYTKTDEMKIEDFATGKAGIMIHNGDAHIQNVMAKVEQASPNAEISVIAPPEGDAGANMHGWGGLWGGYSVSSGCKNPEAALKLLDYLVSEEGSMLRYYGIEGVHYTKTSDGLDITDENIAERKKEPANRFSTVKSSDGSDVPLGEYAWGPWLGTLYSMTDGKITPYNDYSFLKYKDLAVNANNIADSHITISDMNNIPISDSEFLKTVKKLKDNANIYTLNIITGELELESGWKEYMDKAKEAGYEAAGKTAFETVKGFS